VGGRDVQLLAEDAAVDLLVDDNTNSSLVHVEHNTGSAVVVLEGHTLVDGGIHLDINIVTSLCVFGNVKSNEVSIRFPNWQVASSTRESILFKTNNLQRRHTNLEVSQVGGGVASAVGLEGLLEQSAGGSTITKTVGHF